MVILNWEAEYGLPDGANTPSSVDIEQIPNSESAQLTDLSPRKDAVINSTSNARRRHLLRIVAPIALIALWQISSVAQLVSTDVLPSPFMVIEGFKELISAGDLQAAIPVSLGRSLLGLLLGGTTGLILGLFAGLWRVGEELFDASLQMLRTIPFIALVPLFIAWFGIDELPKILLITAATIFPMYLNTYSGVRGVDNKLIEAAKIFGLTPQQIAWRVILPTALPSILVGLRYAAGTSVLALVAAEQINARSGIGYIVNTANLSQRPDIVIGGIVIYAVLGILTDLTMRFIERVALPWRAKIALA